MRSPQPTLGGTQGTRRNLLARMARESQTVWLGAEEGTRQLQPQDLGQGLPSHPEGCQAGRGSSELSRRKELLTEGSVQRRGHPEGSGRPVLTAVKHRGAGPAQRGCPGGPRASAPAGVCGRPGGRQGGWATCMAASERQQGCRRAPGGRQGNQRRSEEGKGVHGGGQRAGGGAQRAGGPIRTAPPPLSPILGLHGTLHLGKSSTVPWGKQGLRPWEATIQP